MLVINTIEEIEIFQLQSSFLKQSVDIARDCEAGDSGSRQQNHGNGLQSAAQLFQSASLGMWIDQCRTLLFRCLGFVSPMGF